MATPELIQALELVYSLADGNCQDREVNPVKDGDELEREAYRQRKALDRVNRFIQNIKFMNDNKDSI